MVWGWEEECLDVDSVECLHKFEPGTFGQCDYGGPKLTEWRRRGLAFDRADFTFLPLRKVYYENSRGNIAIRWTTVYANVRKLHSRMLLF